AILFRWPMKLDKTEIARRQLGTALALFLEDNDPVSVHALACAGCEIAEYLTRKAGEEPFSTHALLTFPDLSRGKLQGLRYQYWNALKHALTRDGLERKDSVLLERFEDEVNEHAICRLARLHACGPRIAHRSTNISGMVFRAIPREAKPRSRYNDTSAVLSNASEQVPGRPERGAARGHLLVPKK